MLKAIEVEGFMCFGTRQRAPLSRLNLVFGPNSGGKSSLLRWIKILSQSGKGRSFTPSGPLVRWSDYASRIYGQDQNRDVLGAFEYELRESVTSRILDAGLALTVLPAGETLRAEFRLGPVGEKVGQWQPMVHSMRLCEQSARGLSVGLDRASSQVVESSSAHEGRGGDRLSGHGAGLWATADGVAEEFKGRFVPWLAQALGELGGVELIEQFLDGEEKGGEQRLDRRFLSAFDIAEWLVSTAERDIASSLRAALAEWGQVGIFHWPRIFRSRMPWWRSLADRGSRPEVFQESLEKTRRLLLEKMRSGLIQEALDSWVHAFRMALRKLPPATVLPPLRDCPKAIYSVEGESTSWGKTALALQHQELREQVNEALVRAEVPYDLLEPRIVQRSEGGLGVQVRLKDLRYKVEVGLPEIGAGISQMIPVMVAAIQRAGFVFVEQPELHLHPRLEAAMADVLIDAVLDSQSADEREGGNDPVPQWFVETHGEALMVRVQRRIREGRLPAEHVSVLYVHSPEEVEGSVIRPLSLDEKGFFLDPWPDGFFEEGMDEAMA